MPVWLQEGDEFGDFRILACLPFGGQANIFRAQVKGEDSQVCLKIFRDRAPGDESSRRLISHYSNLWKTLGNEFSNYAYVPFRIEDIDDELVAVLRWSNGQSLRHVLSTNPSWTTRYRIAERLTYVVRWLHKIDPDRGKNSRIVHLDLKPENILVEFSNESGEIKPFIRLIDFDNARIDGVGAIDELLGSPHYRSPEQARSHSFDQLPSPDKSDVFSLAIILVELLCGKRPYPDETFDAATESYGVDLSHLESLEISRPLLQGILLALHPRPEARPGAGRLHNIFYENYRGSGLASSGVGTERWTSPTSFITKLTQSPLFERVYRYEDGPTRIGYRHLAGARFLPSNRDWAIELLPSPAGWYLRPSDTDVMTFSGGNCLNRGKAEIELLANCSYYIHFGNDSRFALRLVRL